MPALDNSFCFSLLFLASYMVICLGLGVDLPIFVYHGFSCFLGGAGGAL